MHLDIIADDVNDALVDAYVAASRSLRETSQSVSHAIREAEEAARAGTEAYHRYVQIRRALAYYLERDDYAGDAEHARLIAIARDRFAGDEAARLLVEQLEAAETAYHAAMREATEARSRAEVAQKLIRDAKARVDAVIDAVVEYNRDVIDAGDHSRAEVAAWLATFDVR